MTTLLTTHPSPDRLQAFAQGRLSPTEMAELEAHVAVCDSCCRHLEQAPDDTLVQLAREAATQGVRSPALPAAPTPDPRAIPPELRDHPRYRVLGLVGTGGMGAVYKAEHRLMERQVALKVINPTVIANPQAMDRFQREFRAAAKLSHRNIVTAYDADTAGDLHFLVMEYVEGWNLDQVVVKRGPLSVPDACNVIAQAANGLQHAHEKGMVHRDIKPQNLRLTRRWHVKILDFGLARLANERSGERAGQGSATASKPGETTAGMILGTPDYIAPEQATDARMADIRADIYSLGCTLYYVLTGQPPFPTGSVIEKLHAHVHKSPQPIVERRSDVPPELVRILDKMMAKDPANRYQTPGEVAKDLTPLARGNVGQASRLPVTGSSKDSPATPSPGASASPEVPSAAADALVPLSGTEYSVLSTSPLDDLALDSALPPLTPVIKPPSSSGLPFGATPQVAVILGLGVAAAIMILAWGLAGWAFNGDKKTQTAQQTTTTSQPIQSSHSAAATNPQVPVIKPPLPPDAKPAIAATTPTPAATSSGNEIAANLPRKVLLVVPSRGLWPNDYWQLDRAFKQLGVEMEVASTSLNPPTSKDGSPTKIIPDIPFDENVVADAYGAIIFAGYTTDEYHLKGSAGQHAQRIIEEFRSKGRIISGICVGQRVLEAHSLLMDRDVARCQYLEQEFGGRSGNPKDKLVVEDGLIVTAASDLAGWDLASAIESHLANP